RKRREVNDRVHAAQVRRRHIAHIAVDGLVGWLLRRVDETFGVVACVEADDIVSAFLEDARQHRPDVAFVASNHDPAACGHGAALSAAMRSMTASNHDWCVVSTTLYVEL